jgi:hypothetical protein
MMDRFTRRGPGPQRRHANPFSAVRVPAAVRRAALAGLLSALLLAVGASGAAAVIVHLPEGKVLSYQPLRSSAGAHAFDETFSNLDYNGGPVMASNTNYAFYWDPSGAPAYPSDYQPGLNRYFEDLAHDSGAPTNSDSVAAQYNDGAGEFAGYSSFFAGAIVDTDPYPPNGCTKALICLTDTQIQTELKSYINAHGLPRDLAHEYFVLTPPEVEDCLTAGGSQCSAGTTNPVYCAYHGDIRLPEGVIVYASDPFVSGNFLCDDGNHPNGTSSDGALEGGLSHEHTESITDPEPNNAWTDFSGSGGEIGDKCGFQNGTPLGEDEVGGVKYAYNQVINGHFYWYQEEWSNQTHQCLQRLEFSGEEPLATFASTPVAGNEVSFNASGSSAPGGVARYEWQFNDASGRAISTPVETASPTLTHTFPEAGVYLVALTVFAADGTSIGTARTLVVGSAPAPTITKVAPNKGPSAGATTITITGTNLYAATAVKLGAVSAAGFFVKSTKTIVALTPTEPVATVDITVATPAGTSAISSADRFKFLPSVSSVTPNGGPTAGGTSVTVTGSGFIPGTSATKFKFGTTLATGVSCTSASECTMTSPPHAAGTVDVKAVVNRLTSAKEASDRYTYS